MKIKDFKLKINSDGAIEIESGTNLPTEKADLDYERYDKLRSLGWSDQDIIKMLKNSKERGRMSEGGYAYI